MGDDWDSPVADSYSNISLRTGGDWCMKKEFYIITTIILTSIYFITLWTMDVSVGAMLTPGGKLFGIFGIENPSIKYHQALYMNIVIFYLVIISLLFYNREARKK